jgi:hypothetical protein
MALKFFNPKISHKRFSMYTRFYDERKERLELKRKSYDERSLDQQERTEILKDKLRDTWSVGKTRQKANYEANFRVVVLICIILGLGYFVFNGLDDIDAVIHKLMGK